MDIYRSTVEYLLTLPVFESWEEMRTILHRLAAMRPRDWKLPLIAFQAFGEYRETVIPGCAGLACAQISIILVDDMLDEDPRGEYRRIGYGRASNLALAFQAAGVEALLGSNSTSAVRIEMLNSLNRMMLRIAHGQDLDTQNPEDQAAYWRVVENKSAPFFGSALALGAILAGAGDGATKNLERLGRLYGEMIQIHDDLNDAMAVPANPDWLQKRKPLPILFALTVDHPGRGRFIELYENMASGKALVEAQEILIRCGAVSYCVDELLRRYQNAQKLLDEISLPNPEALDSLLEGVIRPVWKLFETLGVAREVLSTSAEPLDWK
ncbi:MAG: polyprenyl synthetase family protein [Chloroflexota bacterium]|nr:polyprenyl synthetase family protein [Chloroflexota bacterium]